MNAPGLLHDWTAANQALLVAEFARLKALLAGEPVEEARLRVESCRARLPAPADHPLVDLRTGEWSHGHAPSGELALHVAIMRDVPDVPAVVHTHSPYATGFAVARQPLEFVCNENIGTASQRILVTDPYAPPGSVELADAAVRTFARQPGSRACLLANHGPVAVGASLDAALLVAMEVEWIAQITFVARSVGPVHVITSEHQDAIARSCGVIVGREHGVHDRRS